MDCAYVVADRFQRQRLFEMIARRALLRTVAGATIFGGASVFAGVPSAPQTHRPPVAVTKHVEAGVLDVAYLESGPTAGQPVLLLHGFPYDVHAFDEVAQHLAGWGWRVIVPYLRGFGPTTFIDPDSPRVGQQAALAQDVIALLDALGIARATLAGFDWGGRAACVVAALRPERVTGLVSAGGPGYNIQNEADFLTPRAPKWERQHWFYWYLNSRRGRSAFSRDPRGLCRYLWHEFSPNWRFDDETFDRTADSFDNPDFVPIALHSYRFRIGEVAGDPGLEWIERTLAASPRITVPTIVIQGADEGVDSPESEDAIDSHFEDLRCTTVLRGIGHNAPQEAPRPFADAIAQLGRQTRDRARRSSR